MKNIFTPLLALFLSFQAHSAVHTIKFVDANGKEPAMQHYDQLCQLVDCDTEENIQLNHVQLSLGDELDIQVPKGSFWFPAYYSINNITDGIENLNVVRVEASSDKISDDCFSKVIKLVAVAPGGKNIDIYSTHPTNFFNAGVDHREGLVGSLTITVL